LCAWRGMRASAAGQRLVAVVVLALCCQLAGAADNADGVVGMIESNTSNTTTLIPEEVGVCAGQQCGLCTQPCADACCGDGTKPECCSQHVNVTFHIPYSAPLKVATTPCPGCDLCASIMAQLYVAPEVKACCEATPCGSIKEITNSAPEQRDVIVQGTNPYGANWTYEKHVKKFGINTASYADSNITKAAVAAAVKDAQKIVAAMSNPEPITTPTTPTSQSNSSNASTPSTASRVSTNDPKGVAVILLPPGVNVSDWEGLADPPTKVSNASNTSNSTDTTAEISLGETTDIDESDLIDLGAELH